MIIFLKKEHLDDNAISSALQKNNENVAEELQIHFVYAGSYNHSYYYEDRLRSLILNGMKKHKIQSVMMTSIYLKRLEIITKQEMESFCQGEKNVEDSVNDDLESLFENIRLEKELDERVVTYFLPKLTEEQLELVERRDTNYFKTFAWDVSQTQMMLSESDTKYVRGWSWRRTFVIENLSEKSSKTSSENTSETSSKILPEILPETSPESSSGNSSDNLIENLKENSSEKQSCLKNCCNCSLQ